MIHGKRVKITDVKGRVRHIMPHEKERLEEQGQIKKKEEKKAPKTKEDKSQKATK